MADTNQRKRSALDSPLFKLIEETWIDYDSKISSFSIGDEDVFRYTLWCIEGLKDNSGNRERHEDKMRALLFKLIRKECGAGSQPKDLDLLADIIMAYTLECLEWAQTADWTTFMSLYDKVSDSIASNKETTITYKKEFNNIVFEKDLCHSFKQWIVDYMTNDEFLTDENGAWANIAPKTQPRTIPPVEVKKQRPVGRPKATDKPFGDYVSDDVAESEVIESIKESLTRSMGSACNVGEIIKDFIKKSILKEVVPYKLLKKQFGELITCNESDYNKQVKDYR